MRVKLEQIKKVTSNRAGIRQLFLALESEIIGLPNHTPVANTYEGALTLVPGARIYPFYYTNRSASFSESTNTSNDAGDYSESTLQFRTPHDRPATRLWVERLKNKRVAVIYQDWNLRWKILRGLRAKCDIKNSALGSYNGTSFQLAGEQTDGAGFWEFAPNNYFEETGELVLNNEQLSSFRVNRQSYAAHTGSTLPLPADVHEDERYAWVFRNGLVPWGAGVTRAGEVLVFYPALQNEVVELVWFTQRISSNLLEPQRWVYANQSGATLAIDAAIAAEQELTYVFRGTRLISWGAGVTRTGDALQFTPELAGETVEVVSFQPYSSLPAPATFVPYRRLFENRSGATLNILAGVPENEDYVLVYRGTSLIPWGAGVTRTGAGELTFTPALAGETVELTWFAEQALVE